MRSIVIYYAVYVIIKRCAIGNAGAIFVWLLLWYAVSLSIILVILSISQRRLLIMDKEMDLLAI